MARPKFRIEEEDVMDVVERRSELPVVENSKSVEQIKEFDADNARQEKVIAPKVDGVKELEQKKERENVGVIEDSGEMGNLANEVKIKLNFSTYKREAKSCKKMILIKPSTNENVDLLLKSACGGMSFNELVNQLLEGWVEDFKKSNE